MGNSSSTSAEYKEFRKYYIKHGEDDDPRYGHIVYYHHRNQPSDLILLKDKWTNSLSESQDINTFVLNRQSITHPNLALCRNYIQEEDKQWCSTFYKHNLAFEYFDNNLAKEISKRKTDGEFAAIKDFREPEIWYLVNSAVNANKTLLDETGSTSGDTQPNTCLLDGSGQLKLVDSGLLHLNKSTYQRMLYDKSIKAAVSPTLLTQLQQKKVNAEYDISKEESWSIGMTALCMATQTELDDYYDWSVPELRTQVLNENLDSVNGPYSKQLHGFIESCLEETEDRRPSLEDHQRFLRPYQKEINDIQLDFKRKPVAVQSTVPILLNETRQQPAPRIDPYNGLVWGDDNFFANPTQEQIVRELQPVAPVVRPLNLEYDDFFGQQTTVVEDDGGNFFFR